MKPLIFAIAILSTCVSALAQTGTLAANVASDTTSTAAASNAGNNQAFNPTLMFNQAAASPYQVQDIRYSGTQSIKTVPNIVAPGLVATPATCLGSKSGGGSFLGAGGTAASTVADVPCNGREGAKLFHVMGMFDAAIERLCAVPEEATAIEAAFLKARERWVDAAHKVNAENIERARKGEQFKPLPELKATPRCRDAQLAEDRAQAVATMQGGQVSASTMPSAGTLAAAGVTPREQRLGSYAMP